MVVVVAAQTASCQVAKLQNRFPTAPVGMAGPGLDNGHECVISNFHPSGAVTASEWSVCVLMMQRGALYRIPHRSANANAAANWTIKRDDKVHLLQADRQTDSSVSARKQIPSHNKTSYSRLGSFSLARSATSPQVATSVQTPRHSQTHTCY